MSPAVTIDAPVLPAQEILAPVHLIRDPDDARPIDAAHVANLAVSIEDAGLDHPIGLRALRPEELNDDGCVWMRTRGGHRLAAFRLLEREAIPAKVRDQSAEVAKLAEIDENLLRRDYTPLERAQAFAERLEAWGVAYPDRVQKVDGRARAKRGRPDKSAKFADFLEGRPPLMGFAADTASQAGLSLRTVEQALSMFRGIPAGQQARLHGTWIAKNDAALRQLAMIGEAEEQTKVIDLLLAGKTKNISDARAMAAGTPIPAKPVVNTVQRDFEKAWKAASPTERDGLLHWLSGQVLPKGWAVGRAA